MSSTSIIQGRARMFPDPMKTAAAWRQLAADKGLSIREVVIETTGRQTFIGTPSEVAEAMDHFVQSDGSDGFVLAPHLTPTGLDDFVDLVVPLLQERGVLRAEYETDDAARAHGPAAGPPAGGAWRAAPPARSVKKSAMRASVLEGVGARLVVVDDVDVEDPHPGEVRVQVTHCGVCHSDLHFVHGDLPTPFPVVLGHEAAGVVESVGAGVDSLAVGDKVILTLQPQCGRCYFCARGAVHLCRLGNGVSTGVLPDGGTRLSRGGSVVYRGVGLGGFAEQVVAPASCAVKVAADTPLEIACLLGCAVQTGVGAVLNTAKVGVGDTVMVIGLGGVGHLGRAGRPAGRRVAHRRRRPGRRAGGPSRSAFGVTDAIDPAEDDLAGAAMELTGGIGLDHVIDTAATPATISERHHGHPPRRLGHHRRRARLRGHRRAAGHRVGAGREEGQRFVPRLVELAPRVPPPARPVARRAPRPREHGDRHPAAVSEIPDAFDDLLAGHGLRTVDRPVASSALPHVDALGAGRAGGRRLATERRPFTSQWRVSIGSITSSTPKATPWWMALLCS